ncbi:syntaxin-12-like [Artemia franciscana]|uniref:syntaxin-12-like n=1 Tax=Artemia franciscana TaxID=6661 RepID=UPI0032D9B196
MSTYTTLSGYNRESAEFDRLHETSASNIQKITSNVSQIQQLFSQIGTPSDNQQLRSKLQHLQHYTGQVAKETSKLLKDLSNLPQPSSAGEQRRWKLQKDRLTSEFTTALNAFQSSQRATASKEREEIRKTRAASSNLYGPFGDEAAASGALIQLDGTPKRSQMQAVLQDEAELEILRERERAIRQLESDIVDVNTIFKDLATMVHEQGEMIDSIEANVESATMRVEEGTNQLRTASNYQTKARKKKAILLGIGILILVILIIVIIVETR